MTTTTRIIASTDADGTRYVLATPGFAIRPWYVGPVFYAAASLFGRTLTSDDAVLDECLSHWTTPEAAEAEASTLRDAGWIVSVGQGGDAVATLPESFGSLADLLDLSK